MTRRTSRRPSPRRTAPRAVSAGDIGDAALDVALAIAREMGWAGVRLHAVADRLGVPLAELSRAVPDLDALGERLFARADRAMLAARETPGFAALPARERLFLALAAWLDALAPHRPSVRAILGYKLTLAHVHLHAALVVRLSRTVQWWREAAHLDAVGRRREIEEIGLSALFVATVAGWLREAAPTGGRAKARLRRGLALAARLMSRRPRPMDKPARAAPSTARRRTP
jgi:AcrR family transcriptional regulator